MREGYQYSIGNVMIWIFASALCLTIVDQVIRGEAGIIAGICLLVLMSAGSARHLRLALGRPLKDEAKRARHA
jgi:hypothetical protein